MKLHIQMTNGLIDLRIDNTRFAVDIELRGRGPYTSNFVPSVYIGDVRAWTAMPEPGELLAFAKALRWIDEYIETHREQDRDNS